ncbi:FYVE, RhoGEF and PH domain-containing protein 6-like [Genypterus blacodes]|uniref:FYVE, RhoGEF and PH domain-containing protein 6-like n=1 Tax=Genypterus blacodes TaxID=154954 RepID=UPI003F75D6AA
MNSAMQKPPLAPKPRLIQPQRPGPSPSTPRRDLVPHPSPGTPKRVKPVLAPKPCLAKLTTTATAATVTTKPLAPYCTSVTETPKSIGALNSKNGIQQENKKPDWDYIIPICLCSQENCLCLHNTEKKRDGKTSLKGKGGDYRKPPQRTQSLLGNRGERTGEAQCHVMNGNPLQNGCIPPTYANTHRTNHQLPPEVEATAESLDRNLNTNMDAYSAVMRPSLPHRTWSDEANGNVTPPSAAGRGPEDDPLASDLMSAASQPKPAALPVVPRKPVPVPVLRKPRKAVLSRQEKVEEQSEEPVSREEAGINVREVKVSSERKSGSSLSVSAPAPAASTSVSEDEQPPCLSAARRGFPPPPPPPRKKPFLSAPERSPASAPLTLTQDVEEEDLGLDCNVYEMEISVDKEDEGSGKEEEETRREEVEEEEEGAYSNLTHYLHPATLFHQLELSRHAGKCEEDGAVKVAPTKPKRHSGLMAQMLKQESSEEKEEETFGGNERREAPDAQSDGLKEKIPDENTGHNLHPAVGSPETKKPPRSILGKQRAKSFSSADLVLSEGLRKKSFRKLLDLKLSVKMLPKLMMKGGQSAECLSSDTEQSLDGDHQSSRERLNFQAEAKHKLSCPHLGIEQSVDGDEFSPGTDEDQDYENISHYEEIPDYVNLPLTAPQPPAWQSHMYDDENIYEEQEPYFPLQRNPELQHKHLSSERGSVNGNLAQLDDGTSDDDITDRSSFEDDDRSSTSSKGEREQPEEEEEEEATQRDPKKSKIHHIATEIMSSESVFVNVLKLLHIDFRDAVSKASRQSGKPVIEERILNQILYNLPQLYELNYDLLRELEQRVAQWDENAQLADIFVKKGPYLKMYSTYIREFDKNVALLEEQSKKNPAFGSVVREFEASPRCANLALKHYLLKPVQRIPQYQLLLTDYLKNLPADSVDYKDTQAALGIVKEVANHANDIMKQGDNFQKLIQVQCRLNRQHEIVQPGRIFLREGVLKKLSRKVMQPRMFFLFNDVLMYTTPLQSGQFKLNNMLSLAGMKVSKPSQEAYQNELNIESVERSFILSASSATERDGWLEAISMAINDYTRKKITFIPGKSLEEAESTDLGSGAPLGSKAPIWIPDPRTTMCMICTCEFTLTWRRHHCRACGKVVCQSCSSNKHCLEYLKNQLARVCDQCFNVFQQQTSEQAQSATLSPGNKSAFTFTRKHKKIPAALKEVTASTGNSSMSGYLHRSKGIKKQAKRLWFVIKDKVLYTYAASEDVAALESQPLLGFVLKTDSSQKMQFKLYHKKTLYLIFKADDVQTAQRWIDSFKEATVL